MHVDPGKVLATASSKRDGFLSLVRLCLFCAFVPDVLVAVSVLFFPWFVVAVVLVVVVVFNVVVERETIHERSTSSRNPHDLDIGQCASSLRDE